MINAVKLRYLMLHRKSFKSKKASLLLEALLVIVILSIGLTLIIQAMSSSLRALSFSKSYALAAFLTDNKLSEILLNKDKNNSLQESSNFDEPFKEFHYQLSVSPINLKTEELDSDPLNKIDLSIDWKSGKKTHTSPSVLCLLIPSDESTNDKP